MTNFTAIINGLDKPNKNGHIYSKEVLEKALLTKEGPIPVFIDCNPTDNSDCCVTIDNIIGFANVDITTYPQMNIIGTLNIYYLDNFIHLIPVGYGVIDECGNITKYDLIGFSLATSSAFENSICEKNI